MFPAKVCAQHQAQTAESTVLQNFSKSLFFTKTLLKCQSQEHWGAQLVPADIPPAHADQEYLS